MIWITIIILAIYMSCPFLAQLVLFLVNMVIPDPIPYIDEIIMAIGMLLKLEKLVDILESIAEHPIRTILIIIGVILLICFLFF